MKITKNQVIIAIRNPFRSFVIIQRKKKVIKTANIVKKKKKRRSENKMKRKKKVYSIKTKKCLIITIRNSFRCFVVIQRKKNKDQNRERQKKKHVHFETGKPSKQTEGNDNKETGKENGEKRQVNKTKNTTETFP